MSAYKPEPQTLRPTGSNPFDLEYLADNPDWDDLAGTDDEDDES